LCGILWRKWCPRITKVPFQRRPIAAMEFGASAGEAIPDALTGDGCGVIANG
jgi:hypothetical protein